MQLATLRPPSAPTTLSVAKQQPAPLYPSRPAGTEVLADFSYAIRRPNGTTRLAPIEAFAVLDQLQRVGTAWEDAIRAAQELARRPQGDGIHDTPIPPAQAVLQGRDGAWWVAPLVGLHRGAYGPMFIDGAFFDRHAQSLQVARRSAGLAAIVGAERVLDLRTEGSAVIVPSAPQASKSA